MAEIPTKARERERERRTHKRIFFTKLSVDWEATANRTEHRDLFAFALRIFN